MQVTRKSLITGIERTMEIDITPEDLLKYERGEMLIQDIFPHITPNEREFIMTGIIEAEWDEYMKEEDYEGEENEE